jgi:hypothetical protein
MYLCADCDKPTLMELNGDSRCPKHGLHSFHIDPLEDLSCAVCAEKAQRCQVCGCYVNAVEHSNRIENKK